MTVAEPGVLCLMWTSNPEHRVTFQKLVLCKYLTIAVTWSKITLDIEFINCYIEL